MNIFANQIGSFFDILLCSCREKKDTEVQTLETTKEQETDALVILEKENEELREKLAGLKANYAKVLEFAKKNNIELKQRNVPLSGVFASTSGGGAAGLDPAAGPST